MKKTQCAANTGTYRGTFSEDRQKDEYNFNMAFCD